MESAHTTSRPDDGGLPPVSPALKVSDRTVLAALIQNFYKIDLLLGGSDGVIMPVDSDGVLVGIDIVDGISPWTSGSSSHDFYPKVLSAWSVINLRPFGSTPC